MKEYIVHQTQHRLKFDQDIAQFAADGWTLVGPVQFQVFPDRKTNATYYLATFERDTLNKFTNLYEQPSEGTSIQ